MDPLTIAYFIVNIALLLLAPRQKMKAKGVGDFDFPRIDDGTPILYLAGRLRVRGPNVVWYGNLRAKKIRVGFLPRQTVGFKYSIGLQLGLCTGPGVKLRKIWYGLDEPIVEWNNGAPTGTKLNVFRRNAFNSGDGFGFDFWFYDGSFTQTANPYLDAQLDLVSGWRGLSYLVLDGYIGNDAVMKEMSFELERVPDPLNLGVRARIGSEGDVNPANVLYELLTNGFVAESTSPTLINALSFVRAGNIFWHEDEGITVTAGGSTTELSAFFQDILKQTESTLYEDPVTGLINLLPIRKDYEDALLVAFDETDIIDFSSNASNLWGDTKNRVRIQYEDRGKDYQSRTAIADDAANIALQGSRVKGVPLEMKFIKRRDHANRKAASQLNIYSTPIRKIRFSGTRRKYSALRPGSVIQLSYSKYGLEGALIRISKVDLGSLGNPRIQIEGAVDKPPLVINRTGGTTDAEIYAPPESLFSAPVPSVPVYGVPSAKPAYVRVMFAPDIIARALVNGGAGGFDSSTMAVPIMFTIEASAGKQRWYSRNVEGGVGRDDQAQESNAGGGLLNTALALSYATTDEIIIDLVSANAEAFLTAADDEISADVREVAIFKGQDFIVLIGDEFIGYMDAERMTTSGTQWKLKGLRRALFDTVVTAHAVGSRVYPLYTNRPVVGAYITVSPSTTTTFLYDVATVATSVAIPLEFVP